MWSCRKNIYICVYLLLLFSKLFGALVAYFRSTQFPWRNNFEKGCLDMFKNVSQFQYKSESLFFIFLSSLRYSAVFSCSWIFCRLSHVLLCSVVREYSVVCRMFCCVQLFINILSSVTCSAVFSCSLMFCRLSHILLCSAVH